MKAILTLDMPYSMCRQCRLFQSITIFHSVTYWCGGKILIIDNPNEIQDFCPLKPLPEKKDTFCGSSYDIIENRGYNICIDEILGEEDETN